MANEEVLELSLTIKCSGHDDVQLQLAATTTVLQLKQQLEQHTGIFVRNQKLIHKGKVLADAARLGPEGAGLTSGAKLMLLPTSGAGNLRAGSAPAAAAPPPRPRAATTAAAGTSSSRAVGDAAADRFRPPPSLAASAAAAGGGGVRRKAGWGAVGVVALRDLGLTALDEEVLEGLPQVRSADLSHNQLTALPSSLSALSALAALRLSHNALTTPGIPWADLGALTGLTMLLLDHNRLEVLPAALGGLRQLVVLGTGDNCLGVVEEGALGAGLQQVDLARNQLTALPEGLGACSSLVRLDANANAITAIPPSITRLTALQTLLLDNNKVGALPPRLLAACSSLATLGLHANPLTVADIRGAEGYAAYEARRQARSSKQIEARVMAVGGGRGFSEGADVEQWQHWQS